MRKNICAVLSMSAVLAAPLAAHASSHREAPFVTKSPKVDGTDLYAFNSYETGRAGFVTIVANYVPFEDAFGGPNYFQLDPDALYEIEIDNTGDGVEDLTFQFQFKQALAQGGNGISLPIGFPDGGMQNVAVPFINVGALNGDAGGSSSLNLIETYTVNLVKGDRRTGTPVAVTGPGGITTFAKPTDNIGTKSFPGGYKAYASQYVQNITIPGCTATGAKLFVGQRAESFALNIGPTFDLLNAPAAVLTGTKGPQVVPNPLAKKNITSLELEVPAACITQSSTQPVIGVWTTASLRQARVINPNATFTVPSKEGGAWTQVSRLGMPLTNEVVIGLPDKDRWNASEPKNDAQFGKYVTNPTFPKIVDLVLGVGLEPQLFPRADLVQVFLTGVPNVNQFPVPDGGAAAAAEMLRLNTAIAATPAASQNYLGAAGCFPGGKLTLTATGCDPAGFPNGRRPGDDIIDIALDVMEGYLIPAVSPAYAGASPTLFTDGVQQLASQFDAAFPYLMTPNQGANGDGT